MSMYIKNIAPTDLSTAYARNEVDIQPGTIYADKDGTATYVWGVYSKGTGGLTCGANKPCVPVSGSTSEALFTADYTDCDAELKQDVGFPVAAVTHGQRCWFKCKGMHDIKQSLTVTTVANYDPFVSSDDKALFTCTTPAQAAGIFTENPGITPGLLRKVILWGRRWS